MPHAHAKHRQPAVPHTGVHNTLPQRLDALDGLRAVASLGIIVTHVSFQTGTGWGWAERFDYFVAVFFALSAFVLWRRRERYAARGWSRYYRSRTARIAPAYLVCVTAVLAFLPSAAGVSLQQVIANLTSTQIFWPEGLAPGLTHLWSLCVEIAFYLTMPLLAIAADLLPGGRRVRCLVIAAWAAVSLGWAWLPFVANADPDGINTQIWPPAYTLWFAVGMLAAEAEGRVPAWVQRAARWRWLWLGLAAGCIWLASREWFGPRGLTHPDPDEFARRILVGGAFAACVVLPFVFAPRSKVLESAPLQAAGVWSYGIFLWHVAVLDLVFPLLGIDLFSGGAINFVLVWLATVAGTVVVSAAGYEWVERPGARVVRALWPVREDAANTQAIAPAHRAVTSTESPA